MAVKRRSATATLGFAILGPRCSRSAQVGVEELLEARERLVDDGRLRVGLGVEDLAAELSEPREGALESFRDRVVRELRDFLESLREVCEVFGEDLPLDVTPEPDGGEVGRRQDDRGHVADAPVRVNAHVLETVGLLDEPDRLLDPPAREISLDDPPHRLERPVDGKRHEQHHRLLAEALDDDHVQFLLWVHRQSHGHRPELDLDVAFLAVRVELDVVLVPHDALAGKPVDLVHAFPCEDAAARHADDEVPRIVDESPVERGSVASPVVDEDALAPGCGHDAGDDLEDLVVLSLVARRVRRPEPERERNRLALPVLAGDGHAPVVTVDEHVASFLRRPARVPDHRHVFHLESELLADLGRVDEDERVVPDELRAGLEDRLVDVVPDRRVGHVPAQALFDGVALPRVVVDRAHDRRELRVARGLDSVEHVGQELLPGSREMGKHFTQKFSELLFRPEGNCAIIHVWSSPFVWILHPVLYRKTEREDHTPFHAMAVWKSRSQASR